MFNRWLSYFRTRRERKQYEAVINYPEHLTDVQKLRKLLECWDASQLAQIPLPVLRSVAVETLHPDIYHLLDALYSSKRYMRNRETFPAELIRGRHMIHEVRLHPQDLEAYLVDSTDRMGDRYEAFGDLKAATESLLNYLEHKIGPQDRFFEYYLRQNVNLFDELALILKAYLQARFV